MTDDKERQFTVALAALQKIAAMEHIRLSPYAKTTAAEALKIMFPDPDMAEAAAIVDALGTSVDLRAGVLAGIKRGRELDRAGSQS